MTWIKQIHADKIIIKIRGNQDDIVFFCNLAYSIKPSIMKTPLLCFVIYLVIGPTYSQPTYFPLIETGKTWHVMESSFPSPTLTYTYKCDGDTLINDNEYKLLHVTDEEYPTQWTKIGYIREDTNRKVYYSPLSLTFIEPALVYDFNAKSNDTLVITSFLHYYPTEVEIVITEVDSILIVDEYRKRIKFSCEYYDNNFWIEGVGSNNGLLETGFYCYIVCPENELLCVQDQGEIIYQHEYYEECYIVGVEETVISKQQFLVYPNPAKNDIRIVAQLNISSDLLFVMYNLRSEIILEERLIDFNNMLMNIDNLKEGLYLYRIIDNNGLVQNGKIIIKK